jgi:hypothetical protein
LFCGARVSFGEVAQDGVGGASSGRVAEAGQARRELREERVGWFGERLPTELDQPEIRNGHHPSGALSVHPDRRFSERRCLPVDPQRQLLDRVVEVSSSSGVLRRTGPAHAARAKLGGGRAWERGHREQGDGVASQALEELVTDRAEHLVEVEARREREGEGEGEPKRQIA